MSQIPLKYKGILSMVHCPSVSIIILTDVDETRQLSIVCGGYTRLQFAVRTHQINPNDIRFRIEDTDEDENSFDESYEKFSSDSETEKQDRPSSFDRMLPEVLCSIIQYMTNMKLGVQIVNVYDGEYRAVIIDYSSGTTFPINVADGILLTILKRHIPLSVDENIWKLQSVPYKKDNKGVQLPINTLTMPMLQDALKNAIDDERYEAAQALQAEIKRRTS